MRYLIAVTCLSLLAPLAFAATALSESLPPDLVQRMQVSAGAGGAGFVLDPPEDFPAFAYPAEVSVLGSIDEEFASAVVLGEVGADAQARVVQMLLDAGWHYLPDPVPPRVSGFIGVPQRERPPMYCHEVDMGRLSLEQLSNQGERYLLLELQTHDSFLRGAGNQVSCREQVERNQQSATARGALGSDMPRLELPGLDDAATAPAMHSSSNGGGQNDAHATAQVTTASTMNELAGHFAEQLNEQGWIKDGEVAAAYLLTSIWKRELDDGSLLLGVLTVGQTGESSVDLQFRLTRRAAGN